MKISVFNRFVFSEELDAELVSEGFYYDKMRPRFMNGFGWDDLTLGATVLRFDEVDSEDYTVSIFMNKTEFYAERQNPWRGLDNSYRLPVEENLSSLTDIKKLIDELLDWVY